MHKTYAGPPLENGKTSIFGNHSPGIDYFINNGIFTKESKILDYGAGKYGRNTKYLKTKGFNATPVDKFNYNNQFCVLPETFINRKYFDVSFTSYVLNVVPEYIEDEILNKMESLSGKQYHITRGNDLIKSLDVSQHTKNFTYRWILKNVSDLDYEMSMFKKGKASRKCLLKLARFGFATTRGFQRLVTLEDKGFKLISFNNYKIYI